MSKMLFIGFIQLVFKFVQGQIIYFFKNFNFFFSCVLFSLCLKQHKSGDLFHVDSYHIQAPCLVWVFGSLVKNIELFSAPMI